MKLIIEDDEGHRTVVPFVRDEITIGRQEGNTIRLTERNVSRRHARLVRQNGHVVVEDLGSANGIHVNGERINEPAAVKDGDLIQIGDYDLAIQQEGAAESTEIRPRPMARDEAPEDEDDELDTASGLDTVPPGDEPEPPEEPAEAAAPAPSADAGRHTTAVIRVDAITPDANVDAEDLAPEAAPRLVVLNTALGGREFACIRTVLRIGRTDENDITLDHPSLSREHAKLFCTRDGEWRVLDVGSANGLKVNGETYAQSPVVHGDTIELGHVKLAFVAPGKPFRYVPEGASPSKGGGKIVIALLAVVIAAGGLGFWRYTEHLPPFGPGETGPELATPQPTPIKPPLHPVGPPHPVAPSHDEAAPPLATELLEQAKTAADAKDFEKVISVVDRIQGPSVDEAAQAKALRDRATRELAAKQAIDAAEHAADEGDLDRAKEELSKAADTEAYRRELAQAGRRVRLAERAHVRHVRPHPTPASGPSADTLYDQGKSLLRASQFREAATTFGQCLEVDPKMARCHMLLGASLAQLAAKNPDVKGRTGQLDQAAQHYRKFVELAGPEDAREVEKVKQILRSYEAQRHP